LPSIAPRSAPVGFVAKDRAVVRLLHGSQPHAKRTQMFRAETLLQHGLELACEGEEARILRNEFVGPFRVRLERIVRGGDVSPVLSSGRI
jgi:hypothetical protein